MSKSVEILRFNDRGEWRRWLIEKSSFEGECWVALARSRTPVVGTLWYLDAVEEALCFGWIDSTVRKSGTEGICLQRFSPRRRGGRWTELNKARCRRLIGLGMMTEKGMMVLPDDFGKDFVVEDFVLEALRSDAGLWNAVMAQPELYRRVRIDNIQTPMLRGDRTTALRRLAKYVECSRHGVLYGDWDDFGRLTSSDG